MAKRYAVILSDIHIGNGAPTCWYQSSVHEPYLTTALKWVVDRKEDVREVLFLGDMFDVWTYPPSMTPPSMQDLINANLRLLGPGGALAALASSLPGEVRLMLGNHDGTVSRADVDLLNRTMNMGLPRTPARIQLVDQPYRVVDSRGGARTVFSHGHHWCMFNAPDPKSRWNAIPLGHFVSRAIAYRIAKEGKRAVDLDYSGNPPRDQLAIAPRPDLAAMVLDTICGWAKMSDTEQITMPGGSKTTVRDAKRVFADLFTRWERMLGRPLDAARAARADYEGEDLAWFAQRLAMQTASDLVVMGHTHVPVGGLTLSPVSYFNSGYECVSRPDLDKRRSHFTFARIDLDRATAELFAVVRAAGGYTVRPFKAPSLPVVRRPFEDYSCYARIENTSGRSLKLVGNPKAPASYLAVSPPRTIPDRKRADIWVQDYPGQRGSAAKFTYSDGTRTLRFAFSCPFWRRASNSVSSPVPNHQTKAGPGNWRKGGVDAKGHPLMMRFAVEPARAPRRRPPRAPAPAVPRTRRLPSGLPGPALLWNQMTEEQRQIAAANTDYLSVARQILTEIDDRERRATGQVQYSRATVMSYARLQAHDNSALIDTTRVSGRLKNPLNHLSTPPDIETCISPQYGPVEYVFMKPKQPNAPPGGLLFLPRPGAQGLSIVTFTVERFDDEWRKRCKNDHHAEAQLGYWIEQQDKARWQARIGKLYITNGARKRPHFGLSPCNHCCQDLEHLLRELNKLRRPDKVDALISWTDLYVYPGYLRCGWSIDAVGYRKLVESGWDVPQHPRPPGAPPPRRLPPPQPQRRRPPAPAPRVFTA